MRRHRRSIRRDAGGLLDLSQNLRRGQSVILPVCRDLCDRAVRLGLRDDLLEHLLSIGANELAIQKKHAVEHQGDLPDRIATASAAAASPGDDAASPFLVVSWRPYIRVVPHYARFAEISFGARKDGVPIVFQPGDG